MSEKKDDLKNYSIIISNDNLSEFSSLIEKNESPDLSNKKMLSSTGKKGKKYSSPLLFSSIKKNLLYLPKEIKVEYRKKSKKLGEYMLKGINSNSNKKITTNYDNINKYDKKKFNLNNMLQIETGHLNIYERERQNIIRKNNLIKKKKELQKKQEEADLKIPILDKVSENIISLNKNYIPIQDRASQIYNLRKLHNILDENQKKYNKKEKEQKEVMMLRKYINKKPFDENNWNEFIESQENWNRQKIWKKKAVEIIRENIELNDKHKPKINNNSKKIISKMGKRKIYGDDIYDKLYNDFNNMEERKKLKICNSMPSFKPILNKGIKKSVFKSNKIIENNKVNLNKSIEKQIESLVHEKLKNFKNNKNTSNSLNFNINQKNKNIKNKRYENIDSKNKMVNTKIMGKTQDISKNSYLYKNSINKKIKKKN